MTVDGLKALWTKLQPKPQGTAIFQPIQQSHPETRRVTNAALLISGGLFLLILLGLGYTAYSKAQYHQHNSQPLFKTKSATSDIPDWFAKKQTEGIIVSEDQTPKELPAKPEAVTGVLGAGSDPTIDSGKETMARVADAAPAEIVDQERLTQDMEQRNKFSTALQAETTLFQQQKPSTIPSQPAKPDIQDDSNPSQTESDHYLLHTRTPALSDHEIKAGTVIPSVLLSGVDSTLPGQLIAQVTQNVYDTATGQRLLIPQGARLVGSYDHQIAGGQKRVLVVWNRLIYPDASSVTLEGMSGVDMAGYSGFSDKTDTHFGVTFRRALMMSVISAGVQLSQPRATNGYAYSSNQVAAGALGQQMNQVGMNSIGRVQNQPPTLQIRSGYQFNVLVNKDMILPLWKEQQPEATL